MSTISGPNNNAFAAGQMGLQRAFDGVAQASSSIAQAVAQPETESRGLTSDLISLNVNQLNAEASAKVIRTADETLGTLIDTFA